MLSNKKILIGITGGIAAYKICSLIREFIKLNAEVKVVLTPNAGNFVTEATLMSLSKNKVYTDEFKSSDYKPEHISLSESDLFIIAPASANTIGKLANGICDNLLTSVAMAFKNPILIAPAMNCNMWENPSLQRNLRILKEQNYGIVEPEEGYLACGYDGKGRMAEIETIKLKACEILSEKQFLKGKKLLISAGGTKESIDPVRYIGNHSSGKMGIALADCAHEAGAEVILVSTTKVQKPYQVINVTSAKEMLDAIQNSFGFQDALIMAAAPADYRVEKACEQKIKKENADEITLKLIKNPDILSSMSKIKKPNQKIVGFCAESENLIENAKKKIDSKNADFIIANDISKAEIGFNSDYNEVIIINKNKEAKHLEKDTKKNIAKKILTEVFQNA